jgi:hypothetical protein
MVQPTMIAATFYIFVVLDRKVRDELVLHGMTLGTHII